MLIKRYCGPNQDELVNRIKKELQNPIIINIFQFKPRFPASLIHKTMWEIIAGTGFKILNDVKDDTNQNLIKEIANLKDSLSKIQEKMCNGNGIKEDILSFVTKLVSEKLSRKIINQIQTQLGHSALEDKAKLRASIKSIIKELIKCKDGIEFRGTQTRVAFIGPTGVGKTTTLAKVISVYKQRYKKKIAVLTNDEYRLGAVKQLARFCELIEVPLRVCKSVNDIKSARQEFKDYDIIAMDSGGRSQRDLKAIAELKSLLGALEPLEVHLVIGANTEATTMNQIFLNFSPCSFNRVIITKLDEAVKIGIILDTLSELNTHISFITKGQRVPQDIEIADSSRLASLIVGDESL